MPSPRRGRRSGDRPGAQGGGQTLGWAAAGRGLEPDLAGRVDCGRERPRAGGGGSFLAAAPRACLTITFEDTSLFLMKNRKTASAIWGENAQKLASLSLKVKHAFKKFRWCFGPKMERNVTAGLPCSGSVSPELGSQATINTPGPERGATLASALGPSWPSCLNAQPPRPHDSGCGLPHSLLPAPRARRTPKAGGWAHCSAPSSLDQPVFVD